MESAIWSVLAMIQKKYYYTYHILSRGQYFMDCELATGAHGCPIIMEVHTADSIVRGFHVYGGSWSPVIGKVLVCGLLNERFWFEQDPRKHHESFNVCGTFQLL